MPKFIMHAHTVAGGTAARPCGRSVASAMMHAAQVVPGRQIVAAKPGADASWHLRTGNKPAPATLGAALATVARAIGCGGRSPDVVRARRRTGLEQSGLSSAKREHMLFCVLVGVRAILA